MRLIDADKLVKELKSLKIQKETELDEMRNFAVLTIQDAPTVEKKRKLFGRR